MAANWFLAPSLISLRTEFNQVGPGRDKTSDGSIGDAAHSARTSDHNPDDRGMVHAIDVDCSGPWLAGLTMEKLVQPVVLRHRAGLDNRLQNVIYQRRIWSRSWGWTARAYGGVNPHDHHAHFSCRYDADSEASTRPWGLPQLLEGYDMTKSEFFAWMTEWAKSGTGKEALAQAVLTYDPGKDANGKVKPGGIENVTASAATNPTVGAAWALRQATVAPVIGYQLRDRLDLLLKNQGVTDEQLAALRSDIAELPDDVVAELADAGRSPEEVASALRAALGDRAADVGRLLVGA